MQWPRVAAHDAQHHASLHLQHGRHVVHATERSDSMAVRAVAEMVAAMKDVELGVLDAERTADSERDLRKEMEVQLAAADARARAAEAERDRLHQQLEEWKSIAVQHQQQDKQNRERLDATVNETRERLRDAAKDRAAIEKQLSEVSAALAESRVAQRGLEAELEMTRQHLQRAMAFGGQTPEHVALRWGSAEWWRDGIRVGESGVGANATPSAAARTTAPQTAQPAPHLQRVALGADSAGAGAGLGIALEAELAAAAQERERLTRDFGVAYFDCEYNAGSTAATAVGSNDLPT